MRKILLLISIILISSCGILNSKWPSQSFINNQNYKEVISQSEIERNPDYFWEKFDKSPMYPDGVNGILNHIGQNFAYPDEAREKGIEGKIYVEFSITTKGWIENVEIVKSPSEIFNDEAIRVVKTLDRWIPAKLNGEYINLRYTIPINLKLN
ncbi:energy transducer TonB [Muricauda brasiliensis]|uniref:energy transducer TonB n=1 Tax=Muricauda brasiliensis TaxID=2162892 RepID=UPI000D39A449|nr:energy transducer TonB [Muricauda brasiliensis]